MFQCFSNNLNIFKSHNTFSSQQGRFKNLTDITLRCISFANLEESDEWDKNKTVHKNSSKRTINEIKFSIYNEKVE